jgi:hypothetical protein
MRSPTIDTDETQDESDDEMPPLMGVGSEAELSPAQRPAHRMDVDSIQERHLAETRLRTSCCQYTARNLERGQEMSRAGDSHDQSAARIWNLEKH